MLKVECLEQEVDDLLEDETLGWRWRGRGVGVVGRGVGGVRGLVGRNTSGSEQVSHILNSSDVLEESVQLALAPAPITSAAVAAHVV